MKVKQLIAIVLVVAMGLAVLAGCGSKQQTSSEPTTTAQTTTSEGTTSEEGPQELEEMVLKGIGTSEFDIEKDVVAKTIYEKFKIRFELEPIPDDGGETMKLLAASGGLPDLWATATTWWGGIQRWHDFIDQGIIRSVPDELINKYPNIKELVENYPYAQTVKELKGALYGIPRPNQRRPVYQADWVGTFYRKDWAQNVGITKEPTTFDEFYEMLKRFAHNDPDQNGVNDTFGITAPGLGFFTWAYAMSWDCFSGWVWDSEAQQWTLGDLDDNWIPFLEWLQKLRKEGILDPEFAMLNSTQAIQRFGAGLAGALPRNADAYWVNQTIKVEWGGANPDKDPFESVGVIPILKYDDITPKTAEHAPNQFVEFNAKTMTDEKLDRYLMFHNWLLTDEATYLMYLGVEGTHWTRDDQGRIVTMNDPETGQPYDIQTLYPIAGFRTLASWGFDLNVDMNWPTPAIDTKAKELTNKLISVWNQYKYPLDLRTGVITVEAAQTYRVDTTEWANIVLSDEPVDQAFKRWVEKQYSLGAQNLINEYNAKAKEMGILGK